MYHSSLYEFFDEQHLNPSWSLGYALVEFHVFSYFKVKCKCLIRRAHGSYLCPSKSVNNRVESFECLSFSLNVCGTYIPFNVIHKYSSYIICSTCEENKKMDSWWKREKKKRLTEIGWYREKSYAYLINTGIKYLSGL